MQQRPTLKEMCSLYFFPKNCWDIPIATPCSSASKYMYNKLKTQITPATCEINNCWKYKGWEKEIRLFCEKYRCFSDADWQLQFSQMQSRSSQQFTWWFVLCSKLCVPGCTTYSSDVPFKIIITVELDIQISIWRFLGVFPYRPCHMLLF